MERALVFRNLVVAKLAEDMTQLKRSLLVLLEFSSALPHISTSPASLHGSSSLELPHISTSPASLHASSNPALKQVLIKAAPAPVKPGQFSHHVVSEDVAPCQAATVPTETNYLWSVTLQASGLELEKATDEDD